MSEHRTQFAFKSMRKYIAEINIPNMTYPNQHVKIELPHGLSDLIIVLDTIKVTFNLPIESREKRRSIIKNEGRALAKKKVLMLRSKEIERINNSFIYDTLSLVLTAAINSIAHFRRRK